MAKSQWISVSKYPSGELEAALGPCVRSVHCCSVRLAAQASGAGA